MERRSSCAELFDLLHVKRDTPVPEQWHDGRQCKLGLRSVQSSASKWRSVFLPPPVPLLRRLSRQLVEHHQGHTSFLAHSRSAGLHGSVRPDHGYMEGDVCKHAGGGMEVPGREPVQLLRSHRTHHGHILRGLLRHARPDLLVQGCTCLVQHRCQRGGPWHGLAACVP